MRATPHLRLSQGIENFETNEINGTALIPGLNPGDKPRDSPLHIEMGKDF